MALSRHAFHWTVYHFMPFCQKRPCTASTSHDSSERLASHGSFEVLWSFVRASFGAGSLGFIAGFFFLEGAMVCGE